MIEEVKGLFYTKLIRESLNLLSVLSSRGVLDLEIKN